MKKLFQLKKMIVLTLILLTALLFSGCGQSGTDSAKDKKVKVTMFIWAGSNQDVVPKEVVAEYVKKHPNVEVEFVESSNAVMYPKMVAGKKTNPNEPMVNFGYFNADTTVKGINDDMWAPIDPSIVTNIKDIPQQYRTPDNKGIIWGITNFAIVYNKDLVKNPPKSWQDLWNNQEFKGKLALWDYMFYSFMPPVIELIGPQIGATYDKPEAAFEFLGNHVGQIHSLVTSNDQLKNLLVAGEVLAAPFSTQVAQTWIEQGAPLAVSIPKEGFIPLSYYLQVVKGSSPEQQKVANEIINELLSPAALERYAEVTGTPFTSSAAKVPEKYKNDPSFSVEEQSKGLHPDWKVLAGDITKWKDLWERLVKAKL